MDGTRRQSQSGLCDFLKYVSLVHEFPSAPLLLSLSASPFLFVRRPLSPSRSQRSPYASLSVPPAAPRPRSPLPHRRFSLIPSFREILRNAQARYRGKDKTLEKNKRRVLSRSRPSSLSSVSSPAPSLCSRSSAPSVSVVLLSRVLLSGRADNAAGKQRASVPLSAPDKHDPPETRSLHGAPVRSVRGAGPLRAGEPSADLARQSNTEGSSSDARGLIAAMPVPRRSSPCSTPGRERSALLAAASLPTDDTICPGGLAPRRRVPLARVQG